ncbi:MAG: sodium-dependent bicarbonate transport family permease, partial [Microcoleus sp. SU_5_6]|nr:sodium-dependent bicarbonate transport family permease [Microcoleus sp. SU_5_6]
MDFLSLFVKDFIIQLQSPTLAFLIGGMILAALGSELVIPESICTIIVFMLLTKIGLTGGIAIRNSNLLDMVLPMISAVAIGIIVVFIARYTLAKLPNVKVVDAIATGGVVLV